MKRVLVFQHMDHDTVGRFGDFFAEDNYLPRTIRLWEGEPIPTLSAFDFLFVLGGAQDVWEEDKYPWLIAEKEAIREWVSELARPYLGVCLGHQLLANALGGEVAGAAESEVGVHTIAVTPAAAEDTVFNGLGGEHQVMQWHHAEVKSLPAGVRCLASSATTQVQAVAVDHHAVGLQFHAEFTPQTVASWQSIPSYIAALEKCLGPGAYPRLVQESYPMLPQMGRLARRIYDNLTARSGVRRAA